MANNSNNNNNNNGTKGNNIMGIVGIKALEAELRQRIDLLEAQLKSAKEQLKGLQTGSNDNDDDNASSTTTKLTLAPPKNTITKGPPAGKRGYVYKWVDKSMGWGGTKWALRFLSLEGGRLAYFGSHTEKAPRYVLPLQGCDVRDDGWKRNRRHYTWKGKKEVEPPLSEPGAYFFVFSIVRIPDDDGTSSENADYNDVAPLLRFSTTSLADKALWIQRIADACLYCESEEFLEDEARRAAEAAVEQQQQMKMREAMPESNENGTLPPLYFAPAKRLESLRRRPSFGKSRNRGSSQKLNANQDVDEKDARSTKSYPASKPMHRFAAPSLLSGEAKTQNFRGLFNLGAILLAFSNVRILLESFQRYGFGLSKAVETYNELPSFTDDPWGHFPFISGGLLQVAFLLLGFCIEWALAHKHLNESLGMGLHHINAHLVLFSSIYIVWCLIESPIAGAVLLFHGTITWMKLISYLLANEDYRRHPHQRLAVQNLDDEEVELTYPENVTVGNMFYFWCAPTLTYQIAFPKYPTIRWWKVGTILMRFAVVAAMITFISAQIVNPSLAGLLEELKATDGTVTLHILFDHWLKLAVASTYVWLLIFYGYFHLYLNFFAEVLRFGDRVFYKDWWNSSEASSFWRLWNIPVHYWLIRHVYFPFLRLRIGKKYATICVFLFSAVMHEVLVSVPFHMIRPWSFLGMMMQIPLVTFTKALYRRYPGSSLGNIIFWLSFCLVGQPIAVLLYTVDYQYKLQTGNSIEIIDECRVFWGDRCLVG